MVDPIVQRSSDFSRAASPAPASGREPAGPPSRDPRTVRDTVEIGAEGGKRINLARAGELARGLPDAAQRETFDAALIEAQADIRRITDLFGAVLQQLGGHYEAGGQFNDTTKLTTGGESVVNLSQTQDLVRRIEAGDLQPGEFAAALERAQRDVHRITTLFTETVKAAFAHDHRV